MRSSLSLLESVGDRVGISVSVGVVGLDVATELQGEVEPCMHHVRALHG